MKRFNKGYGSPGIIYALGFIGAVIYYIQHSGTFLDGIIGVLKAFVWPAFMVYRLIGFLGF